jgi:hypothetical protein
MSNSIVPYLFLQFVTPSNVWTISTEDRNKIEVLTRGQSNNKEWFNQRAGKLLITKLVSIPNRTIGQFMIKLQTCFWERCQGL